MYKTKAYIAAHTDAIRWADFYLQTAVKKATEQAAKVRKLSKSEHTFGREISDQLSTVVPDIIAEMQRIVLSPDSTIDDKLRAAEQLQKIHHTLTIKTVSPQKSAAIVKKASVKADATALKRRLAAEKSHRRVEETLRRAEKSLEEKNASTN